MKKTMIVCGACALLFAACQRDDDGGNDNVNTNDRNFVTMASISNNAEVAAGQVAATKGTNSMVKTFGQQMVSEHTAAQADLKNRATTLGLTAPDSVDAEHMALMARLNSLNGYSFDTAYMNSQVKDHAKTIDLFNTEIANGNNQTIRSYATQYLPNIQMHYMKADSIRRKL